MSPPCWIFSIRNHSIEVGIGSPRQRIFVQIKCIRCETLPQECNGLISVEGFLTLCYSYRETITIALGGLINFSQPVVYFLSRIVFLD